MYHIEKNGEGALLSEDVGLSRVVLRYFESRPEALRFLEGFRDSANREVGRKKAELERAEQQFDMISASLEGEAP